MASDDFQRNIGSISPVIVEPLPAEQPKPLDVSGAEFISTIGESALGAYSTAQTRQLGAESTELIDQYLASNNTNSSGEVLPDNEPVVLEARQKAQDLTDAVDSGVMSETQMRIRMQSLMRSYINRAPGLANNFRKISSQTLGDYDAIIDAVANGKKATAANDKLIRAAYMAKAKEFNIQLSLPEPALRAEVDRRSRILAEAAQVKEGNLFVEATREAQVNKIKRGMGTLINAGYEQMKQNAQGVLDSSANTADKVAGIDFLYTRMIAELQKENNGAVEPGALSKRTEIIKNVRDLYTRVAEGRIKKEVADIKVQTLKLTADSDFLSQPGMNTVSAMMRNTNIEFPARFMSNYPQISSVLAKAMGGVANNILRDISEDPEEHRNIVDGTVETINQTSKTYVDSKGEEISADTPVMMVGGLVVSPGESAPIDVFNAVLATASQPDFAEAVKRASPEVTTQINNTKNFVGQYLFTRWIPALSEAIGEARKEKLTVLGAQDPATPRAGSFFATVVNETTGGISFVVDQDAVDEAKLTNRNIIFLNQEIKALKKKFERKYMSVVRSISALEGHTNYGKTGVSIYKEMQSRLPIRDLSFEEEEDDVDDEGE